MALLPLLVSKTCNFYKENFDDNQFNFSAPEPTSLSVIFEAPHSSNFDYSNSKTIQESIDKACSGIESSSVDTAHLISNLIQVVRQSSVPDLLKSVNANKNKCGA